MTDKRTPLETAEVQLYEELGFSFKRQNSALTVIIFGPPTRIESLVPADRKYTAHFEMDKAWKKLVELRAEVSSLESRLQATLDKADSDLVEAVHDWIGRFEAAGCTVSGFVVTNERAESAESRLQAVTEALQSSDSMLSLLRHRQESTIKWGTPGLPELREVDAVIGASRKALAVKP
jgi:hypothetical protein